MRATYAVLGHPDDPGAALVAAALGDRVGPGRTALVWAQELALARRWRHRVTAASADGEVVTATGTRLRSDDLAGVVCRLQAVGGPPFRAQADRDYAIMELHALVVSWLAGLACPVVNDPRPHALGGPALGALEWLGLAAAAGLRARGVRLTTDAGEPPGPGWSAHRLAPGVPSTLWTEPVPAPAADEPVAWLEPLGGDPWLAVVAGDEVLGGADAQLAAGCRTVARRAGAAVLGVHLAPGAADGALLACGADPRPPLDEAAADAVARHLLERAAR